MRHGVTMWPGMAPRHMEVLVVSRIRGRGEVPQNMGPSAPLACDSSLQSLGHTFQCNISCVNQPQI